MKTALVISGGGSHGAFAVGVIEVLWKLGWKFDIISGTSTGALIASLAAIDDVDTLVKIYTSVCTNDILRLNWRRCFYNAIYDTKPLEKLIRKTMKGKRFDAIMSSSITILFCRVGFQSGKVFYGSQRSILEHTDVKSWKDFNGYVKALLASTNQPVIMPPIYIDGEPCFDGEVREVIPFRIVKELGAEKVVVISNSPSDSSHSKKLFKHLIDIGPRALDLMTTEICNDDLLTAATNTIIIRPTYSLPGNSLKFVPEEMQKMRKMGQEKAQEILI
jgi:predicted acylesterase/phospholipase RssA